MYSEQILKHFQQPRNVGQIDNADGFGQASGGEHCPEDLAYFWIRVQGGRIAEVRQKTRGCPVAIAASSITTVLAEGKSLDEALRISSADVVKALGEVPDRKLDSIVGPQALHAAVENYRARQR